MVRLNCDVRLCLKVNRKMAKIDCTLPQLLSIIINHGIITPISHRSRYVWVHGIGNNNGNGLWEAGAFAMPLHSATSGIHCTTLHPTDIRVRLANVMKMCTFQWIRNISTTPYPTPLHSRPNNIRSTAKPGKGRVVGWLVVLWDSGALGCMRMPLQFHIISIMVLLKITRVENSLKCSTV